MLTASSSKAQFLDRLAREALRQAEHTAEDRATEEVQKEVDKQVNKAIDEVLKSDSIDTSDDKDVERPSRSDSERAEALMNAMGVSTADIDYKESYTFTAEITTLTTATNDDGTAAPQAETVMVINSSNKDVMFSVLSEEKLASTIVDNENGCVIILTEEDGKKGGVATKFNIEDPESVAESMPVSLMEYAAEEDEEVCTPVKTGKSKTISGFKCHEYRCETNDEINVMWLSNDIKLNKRYEGIAWLEMFSSDEYDGVIVQFETYSKNNKSSSVMTLTSIDWSKTTLFSTKEYEISSFSFGVSD